MPYGIDIESFEYVHDGHGKRTKALVPVSTLNALVEFWCAARRAQSDALETRARPGMKHAPLRIMVAPSADDDHAPPPSSAPPFAYDDRWRALTEKIRAAPASPEVIEAAEVIEAPSIAPSTPAPSPKLEVIQNKLLIEPRAPEDTDYPNPVLAHLLDGKSPLLAWRLHRRMTLSQLADAYGTSTGNIKSMEGRTRLRSKTVAKLCSVLRCKPAQLLRPEGLEYMKAEVIDAAESPASRRITEKMRASA